MKKYLKLIIKIIAAIIVVILIPAIGLFAYRQTNEAGILPEYIWSQDDEINLDNITTYELEDGEFRILQLTDPQFHLPLALSGRTTSNITKLIELTQPHLIVFTGDVTESPINGVIFNQFVKFMDIFSVPYAVVFGNHDPEGRASKEKLANILSEGEYSIFQYGPSNIKGVGNYVVNVKSGDNIAWSLFMIDSNDYVKEIIFKGDYDYIHQDQIDWYSLNINKMKEVNGGALNSLAFFHIPLIEYKDAYDNRNSEDVIWHFGEKREEVASSKINSGFFNTAKNLDSTRGIFVGHDHVSDFSITYQGIRLTYGLKTGYGSYGMKGVRGGLLITLTEDDFSVEQIFVE